MSARRPLRSAAVLVAAMVVGVVLSAGAKAAPGDLDPTFSGDGKQRTAFRSGLSQAAATVRQPDGKIVAVGTGPVFAGTVDFALVRYNPNGSLDTSFSDDGKQTTDFGGFDGARGVALHADGKIVVVGGGGDDFAVARYNPNGSLDTSFSGDGRQTTDFGGFDGARGVALQADGKIVVVGGGGDDFALARYNPNGSLDTSFSGDGQQTTDFGGLDQANGVAIQADGRIVAVGGDGDFALARYNPNGSLDPSFSGDGQQTTDFGGLDQANGVAIQADGRIVAVGGDGDFALARYNPNGSLDTSFSGDGQQTTDFGGLDRANGVAIQANGRIVAAGRAEGELGDDFALARYNPNGALDPSFSGNGRQTTDFGDGRDGANGVAIQADGKIVAVGPGGSDTGDFALARYNPSGSLDTSFSGDGRQTTDFGGLDSASAVAIQADGKIVAVGETGVAVGARDFALARYNPNGALDTSFSGDGMQTTVFGGFNPGVDRRARGVAIQADGKIVAVGGGGHGGDFALARYNPNGSLDTSFSGDGMQTTDFGGSDFATGVALQGDGKIVAVGRGGPLPRGFALARYNPSGSLDTSFSGDGMQTTDFGGSDDGARAVALQADGKIVAVGRGGPDTGGFALARYNPNGSLDTSFSGDGKQRTDFGTQATGVAIQANGRIVAVGGGGDFALARYNPNGSLDTSFSGNGKQTTDFGAADFATGMALQGDGKIVAVGRSGPSGSGGDFALARYSPNGSLDTSFSGDGRQTTDFGGSADGASEVALQANGRIVAAGYGLGTDLTYDLAVARYLGG